jgi:hypothetical protein
VSVSVFAYVCAHSPPLHQQYDRIIIAVVMCVSVCVCVCMCVCVRVYVSVCRVCVCALTFFPATRPFLD